MSKLGTLLKSEREKKGLSLHEIGMSLKINPKILKAIEDNDEPNLPAKTFLRGFIKSYAQYLRMDVDQTLQLFQEEFGSTRPEEPKKPVPGAIASETSAGTPTSPKLEGSLRRTEDAALPLRSSNRLYTIIGATVLLVLIAFVAKMMDKYQKESRVTKTEAVAVVEGERLKNVDTLTPKGEIPSSELQLATPVSGPGTETSTTTTTFLSASTTNTTSTSTTTTHMPTTTSSTTTTLRKPTTTTTSTSTSTTIKPIPSTTTSTLQKGKGVEVIVEALNKVSIKSSLGNGKTEIFELTPDQVHTFRSTGNILLEISDGGAVNIIVDGRDKGVPGTIGKSLKLSFP